MKYSQSEYFYELAKNETFLKLLDKYKFLEGFPKNLEASQDNLVCYNYPDLCNKTLDLINIDNQRLNIERLSIFQALLQQGTSLKNILHFSQIYKNGYFSRFDYGPLNMEYYNQTYAPEIDIS